MTPYEIHGDHFLADVEGHGAFNVFNPESKAATDTGPRGMVEELRAFIRLTAEMRSFVDVGALFGIFSILFTRNPGTKAWALEPSPYAFPILVAHCAANDNRHITPLRVFAGRETGRKVDCCRDWKHVIANREMNGEILTLEETRLDDLDLVDVDCMKIDVEGHEGSVLRGAEKLIRRCRPMIFLEAHRNDLWRDGESAESLFNLFQKWGYTLRDYSGVEVLTLDDCSMTRVVCHP